MKVHTGIDAKSKLIHTMKTSTASVHDSQFFDECLHGEEQAVFADRAYISADKKRKFRSEGKFWGVQEKAGRGKTLSSSQKKRNKKTGIVRAGVEHPYLTIKHHWGHKTVRYKGIAKNTAQFFSLCFLANLHRVRFSLAKI